MTCQPFPRFFALLLAIVVSVVGTALGFSMPAHAKGGSVVLLFMLIHNLGSSNDVGMLLWLAFGLLGLLLVIGVLFYRIAYKWSDGDVEDPK